MTETRAQPAALPQGGIPPMVLAMFIVPMGDALSKMLAEIAVPFEVAFWRFMVQTVILAAVALALRQPLRGTRYGLLALGGFFTAVTLSSLIGAFTVMPIATAISIFFVEPLILTVFSVIFLGEKAGWRRYLAVGVGLFGAVIVIRPNWATFGWMAVLPLLAATSFAASMVVLRKVSTTGLSSLTVQFWVGLFATLTLGIVVSLGSLAGLLDWRLPEAVMAGNNTILLMLLAMGMLSSTSYFLISVAFQRSPASLLAPFQYLEIIGAVVLGYVLFNTFPDALTWLGLSIILGSGLYVAYRERKLQKNSKLVPTER